MCKKILKGLIKYKNKIFVKELMRKCEQLNHEDTLFYACFEGDQKEIERLIECGFRIWNTGLFGACVGGNKQIAEMMIERGASNFNESQFLPIMVQMKK